jgi:hypothetical protein
MAKSLENERIKALAKRLSKASSDLGFTISDNPTESELKDLITKANKAKRTIIGHYIKI